MAFLLIGFKSIVYNGLYKIHTKIHKIPTKHSNNSYVSDQSNSIDNFYLHAIDLPKTNTKYLMKKEDISFVIKNIDRLLG